MTPTEPDGESGDKATRRFDAAIAARNLEIELFWKRSIFFWGFVAATFVGYATTRERAPAVATMLACFGWVCAIAWTLANRGSKYWYENWEQKVERFEDEVTGPLFKVHEPVQRKGWWLSARRFSVSRLAIGLSDYFVVFWTALVVAELLRIWSGSSASPEQVRRALLGFVVFSIAFGVVLGFRGR